MKTGLLNFRALFLPLAVSLLVAFFCQGTWAQPFGFVLNPQGANSYVGISLASPPTNDYTISAWVYLRSGAPLSGPRIGVLSSPICNSTVEFLIRNNDDNAAGPQYLELGRCGGFNGTPSTNSVPLNVSTQVAVTLSFGDAVSYYINGHPAGSFTDANAHNYALGTSVTPGYNTTRKLDGLLDEVQIWNRALSPAEMLTNGLAKTGNEPGLYAYYRFNEGAGNTTQDSAAAAGGSAGTLIGSTAWTGTSSNIVSTLADSGPGSLRDTLAMTYSGYSIYLRRTYLEKPSLYPADH